MVIACFFFFVFVFFYFLFFNTLLESVDEEVRALAKYFLAHHGLENVKAHKIQDKTLFDYLVYFNTSIKLLSFVT